MNTPVLRGVTETGVLQYSILLAPCPEPILQYSILHAPRPEPILQYSGTPGPNLRAVLRLGVNQRTWRRQPLSLHYSQRGTRLHAQHRLTCFRSRTSLLPTPHPSSSHAHGCLPQAAPTVCTPSVPEAPQQPAAARRWTAEERRRAYPHESLERPGRRGDARSRPDQRLQESPAAAVGHACYGGQQVELELQLDRGRDLVGRGRARGLDHGGGTTRHGSRRRARGRVHRSRSKTGPRGWGLPFY